jgi:hypothetical protein
MRWPKASTNFGDGGAICQPIVLTSNSATVFSGAKHDSKPLAIVRR